ncbi:MAG: dihydropteroate synthase [Desulfuromonadaceae bacterium GWC2_58_13]|nr:MAG: dihydropteroate synthase [Desulfuromonadaceae bacterium GWC2_58_13]
MPFSPRLIHVETEAEARREILRIGADPGGVERMAAKMVNRLVALVQVPCRAANILKQEMLSVGGDAAVARGSVACSVPETDVILIGNLKQLRQLGGRLELQPFGLRELAGELRGLLARLDRLPAYLAGRSCRLSLDRPRIMGILNVTPDSFSDGGCYFSLQAALEKGLELAREGADIIDVGGESTRPGALPVSTQEEIDRVAPVIEALSAEVSCPLSVDTTKSSVAAAAIAAGAEFINDISGLQFDPAMVEVAARSGAGLFLMHTRGRPETMQADIRYQDLVAEVIDYLRGSIAMAEQAGVPRDRLAVDPGIGFGKSVEGNLELLRRIGEFHSLGCPILLGTSRKGFIGKILGEQDPARRLYGTLATVALGVRQGVMIHRVHDVAPARDTAMMAWAVRAAGSE